MSRKRNKQNAKPVGEPGSKSAATDEHATNASSAQGQDASSAQTLDTSRAQARDATAGPPDNRNDGTTDATEPRSHDDREALIESLAGGSVPALRRVLHSMHPAEIADALESLPPVRRQLLWDLVDPEFEGEVLMEVGDEVRENLVRLMDTEELRAATERLDLDDLADFMQSLPETLTGEVLDGMDRADRRRLEQVLSYPEDSAGGLMNLDTITVRGDVTLDVVLRYLRRRGEMPPHTDRIWVTDRFGRYKGDLSIRNLLTHGTDTVVEDIMRTKIEPLPVLTEGHDVARIFEDYDLVSAPVVDDRNHLIGRVTIDDVVDVIRDEAEQSVMSMAGLDHEDDIFAPVLRSTRKRAVWLGVNLLTALLASWVIAQFEGTLERVVTLAVLMSVVPSMGGIAGSQTLTLVIRGQALNQVNASNLGNLLSREVLVGFLNGILWAAIIALLVRLWFGDGQIGLIIGVALVANLVTAAVAGAMLPMLMKRVGIDPALAGGVALTTITDVVGITVFLGLATVLL